MNALAGEKAQQKKTCENRSLENLRKTRCQALPWDDPYSKVGTQNNDHDARDPAHEPKGEAFPD